MLEVAVDPDGVAHPVPEPWIRLLGGGPIPCSVPDDLSRLLSCPAQMTHVRQRDVRRLRARNERDRHGTSAHAFTLRRAGRVHNRSVQARRASQNPPIHVPEQNSRTRAHGENR